MATFGIRKGLEDVAHELKGIRNILASMWHSRYSEGETDRLNPEAFADEYIPTEECSRRLGVSDQTLRNWISQGKKNKGKGWTEGIHYVNVCPDIGKKAVIRIPWNALVQSFAKNKDVELNDFNPGAMYTSVNTRITEETL
tara:strand:- start:946 stop:1368 length:423 start_codon:yes stop_codon:yes gene_type:complete